jgi:muramoyltetrapeptide carboxypeptidase
VPSSTEIVKPVALRPGDRVAVVAPSSPFDRDPFERGLRVLESRYRAAVADGIFDRRRYLAGEDASRVKQIASALEDREVRAIFCARGGYGATRIVNALAPSFLREARKLLVGFSDVTALHALWANAGVASVHGPHVGRLAAETDASRARLFAALESASAPEPLPGRPVVRGTASGRLFGGNLTVLAHLVGTPAMPALRGALLFLEDVGERPYRLDRAFVHLLTAGALEGVAGLVLGSFTDCEEPGADFASADVLRDLARELGVPCIEGVEAGHGAPNYALPLGARATLDANAGRLVFEEGAVA